MLDRLIKDDVESGKLPLLLVANAGEYCGQTTTKSLILLHEYIGKPNWEYIFLTSLVVACQKMSGNILMTAQ